MGKDNGTEGRTADLVAAVAVTTELSLALDELSRCRLIPDEWRPKQKRRLRDVQETLARCQAPARVRNAATMLHDAIAVLPLRVVTACWLESQRANLAIVRGWLREESVRAGMGCAVIRFPREARR